MEGKDGFKAQSHFRAPSAIIPDPSISQALNSSAAAACVGRIFCLTISSHRLITCRMLMMLVMMIMMMMKMMMMIMLLMMMMMMMVMMMMMLMMMKKN